MFRSTDTVLLDVASGKAPTNSLILPLDDNTFCITHYFCLALQHPPPIANSVLAQIWAAAKMLPPSKGWLTDSHFIVASTPHVTLPAAFLLAPPAPYPNVPSCSLFFLCVDAEDSHLVVLHSVGKSLVARELQQVGFTDDW